MAIIREISTREVPRREDVLSGAAAVGLVAAVGGTLLFVLGAVHWLNGASLPDIVKVVSALAL